jgi:hypothetical protein
VEQAFVAERVSGVHRSCDPVEVGGAAGVAEDVAVEIDGGGSVAGGGCGMLVTATLSWTIMFTVSGALKT